MFKISKIIFLFLLSVFGLGLFLSLGSFPSHNSSKSLDVLTKKDDVSANDELAVNILKPRSLEFVEEIIAKKWTYVTGSADIVKFREYIILKMKSFGFKTTKAKQKFTYRKGGIKSEGINLVFSIPSKNASLNNKVIALGAHYDLHQNHLNNPEPEQVFNDNTSGVTTLLALAEYFSKNSQLSPLKFLFWDAEEVGLEGSKSYTDVNEETIKKNWSFYINLDSVAGGDELYVGHGLNDGENGTNDNKEFYEKVLSIAENEKIKIKSSYAYTKDKIGEMYPGSDHVSFNKIGIPVIGFEGTNYRIVGQWGQDGYSQVAHKHFWFPKKGSVTEEQLEIGIKGGFYNEKSVNVGGYSRDNEVGWGKLWHTKNDNLSLIKTLFPGRVEEQLHNVFTLIKELIINEKILFAFQKNWDAGEISNYLLWLPVFDIKEVKLSQNKVVSVDALALAIKTMLTAEKFDFTKLQGKARKQLLNLLDVQGRIRAEKTFQDDVWKQIKNHQKWKTIEGPLGQSVLESIRTLLLKIQDLEISKVAHPFFPKGYDLSFLQDNPNWKQISFQNLLQGMKVAVNGTYVEFYSHLFPNKVVFQVPMKKLSTVFSEITIANIIIALEKAISVQEDLEILAFQNNWDEEKVSSYLLWLPVFDIKEVKLSQNEALPVDALATAIEAMLNAEKFDFTKLQGKARKQLLNLLNSQGKLREVETFQDDVWKQIKNHQKWKTIEGPLGQSVLESIRTLLLKIQDLRISKVAHPFFPKGYDLSFLQDNPNWKQISFQNLLQGMKVMVNGTNVEFYSHLFPNQVVFQVPMKKLSTVFSQIAITNIITALEKAISDHSQQEKKLDSNLFKNDVEIVEKIQIQKKSNISNNNLTIGLSIGGGVLFLSTFGGFLYWFFKVKK